jgi:hypothetical protein
VELDHTKFVNFSDCPEPVLPAPAPVPQPPPVRHLPSLPLTRPLPFGPDIQPPIVAFNKSIQKRQTDFNSDSDSEPQSDPFESPDSSPNIQASRKDIRRAEDLSNRLLATEPQNVTRHQRKKKVRTPPATPNQWPPPKPEQEEEKGCIQQ